MKPTLTLAKQLAGAVLDQVERDRCLNSDRLSEAILARMVVLDAKPAQASTDPDDIERALHAATVLVRTLCREQPPVNGFSKALEDAALALHGMLLKLGKI